MHNHDHTHDHSHHVSRKLGVASFATLVFVGVELTVGLLANSLALIGDALHNFTDTLALMLAWLGCGSSAGPQRHRNRTAINAPAS